MLRTLISVLGRTLVWIVAWFFVASTPALGQRPASIAVELQIEPREMVLRQPVWVTCRFRNVSGDALNLRTRLTFAYDHLYLVQSKEGGGERRLRTYEGAQMGRRRYIGRPWTMEPGQVVVNEVLMGYAHRETRGRSWTTESAVFPEAGTYHVHLEVHLQYADRRPGELVVSAPVSATVAAPEREDAEAAGEFDDQIMMLIQDRAVQGLTIPYRVPESPDGFVDPAPLRAAIRQAHHGVARRAEAFCDTHASSVFAPPCLYGLLTYYKDPASYGGYIGYRPEDLARAERCFDKLLDRYPDSLYTTKARELFDPPIARAFAQARRIVSESGPTLADKAERIVAMYRQALSGRPETLDVILVTRDVVFYESIVDPASAKARAQRIATLPHMGRHERLVAPERAAARRRLETMRRAISP